MRVIMNTPHVKQTDSLKLIGCIIGAIALPIFCVGAFVSFFIIRDLFVYREQIQDWVVNGDDGRSTSQMQVQQTPVPASVAALPPGDANSGRQLFEARTCSACHSLNAGQQQVGPPALGMWARAATRKPTLSAKEYLYESIVAPNAHVASGFPSNVMPGNFGRSLDQQEIADILAFIERDLRGE